MFLEALGLSEFYPSQESVAILVGPNGSGKSNFLRDIALEIRGRRNVVILSNTAYDRFSGMRGVKRLSASQAGRSPRKVILQSVATTIDEPDSRFYQISGILEYCGYQPRFGFRVDPFRVPLRGHLEDETPRSADLEAGLAFLFQHDPDELIWIDQNASPLSFSRAREFASVLRNEQWLRKHGFLSDLKVFLQRRDGQVLELSRASSGELALISSLVFLVTSTNSAPVVLIDEPENSLHPNWQREYVDKVLNALSYRDAIIIIATHAPLVVTGALSNFSKLISVFQVLDGRPHRLVLTEASATAESIEEILWRAFDVITPANHFVSEEIVDLISKFERGEVDKKTVLDLVQSMEAESFDDQQKQFFGAVRDLLDKMKMPPDATIDA